MANGNGKSSASLQIVIAIIGAVAVLGGAFVTIIPYFFPPKGGGGTQTTVQPVTSHPAEPKHEAARPLPRQRCEIQMHDFVAIQAGGLDTSIGTRLFSCSRMQPGATVSVQMQGDFSIDGGGIWIVLWGSFDGSKWNAVVRSCRPNGETGNPPQCHGTNTSAPVALNFQTTSKVPDSGRVEFLLHVERAESSEGINKTLRALENASLTISTTS